MTTGKGHFWPTCFLNSSNSDASIFLLFFSDASERRVWLSAESKVLASTFGRFRLYRLKVTTKKIKLTIEICKVSPCFSNGLSTQMVQRLRFDGYEKFCLFFTGFRLDYKIDLSMALFFVVYDSFIFFLIENFRKFLFSSRVTNR